MEQKPLRSVVALTCAVGAAALAGQTVLIRELMVSFYGTELALAAALCCWLAFIPLGALVAAEALKAARRELPLLCAAVGMIAVGLHVEFLLARLVRVVLRAEVGQFLSVGPMLLGSALAAFPVGFGVGLFFPIAARFEEKRARAAGGGIGRVYVAEALGSAAAGAMLSFYLLSRCAPIVIVFGASAALLFVMACWTGNRRPAVTAACLVLLLVTCASFHLWGAPLRRLTILARWRTFSRFRLAAYRDTRYQHVELGQRQGEYVLVQDGCHTAQFPDPPAQLRRAALLLTQHPAPREVLVIGSGLGGLCGQLLKSPVRVVDYVEADPQLLVFLYRRLPAELRNGLADARFRAYGADARYFVRKCAADPNALAHLCSPLAASAGPAGKQRPAARYDLIVVNLGDPTSAADSRFYTVEFCRELRSILRPGGVVAFCGLTGAENYIQGAATLDYAACIYATLRSAFPHVVVRPGDELCFFAAVAADAASVAPQTLMARFDRLRLQPGALRYAFALEHFPPERVAWLSGLLEQARPRALINSDLRPVLFTLYLRIQAHYAGPAGRGSPALRSAGRQGKFGRLPAAGRWWYCVPLVVVLGLLVSVRATLGRRRAAPWACGFSIFTTGFFGLSASILIIYGYQTSFGYVYRDISILVGLFMLGLAFGGWLAARRAPARPDRPLLAAEAAQAAFVLALPLAAGALSFSPYAFMLLAPAAGFLTGAEFPLAARMGVRDGRAPGTVAGVLDAADHLGALAGAALAGLVLVPVLGLVQTAALLALLKCTSLLGVALTFGPTRG